MNDETSYIYESCGEEIIVPLNSTTSASKKNVELFCGEFRRAAQRIGRKSE
jgi:hypothetical protein